MSFHATYPALLHLRLQSVNELPPASCYFLPLMSPQTPSVHVPPSGWEAHTERFKLSFCIIYANEFNLT
jgi:hypothetical protein